MPAGGLVITLLGGAACGLGVVLLPLQAASASVEACQEEAMEEVSDFTKPPEEESSPASSSEAEERTTGMPETSEVGLEISGSIASAS